MALGAIFLSLFTAQYINAIGRHPHVELDPNIPTVKKQNAESGDSCVGQCAFHFVDQLKLQLGGGNVAQLLDLNYNEFLIAFSNVTFFEGFCKFYHNFQYCYSGCSPSYMQELLSRSATIIDHFCVYNF
uniref:Uncharacterized protein n=1 Tax=Parascaris univalens TaxID=6257 RepID=A0A914ZJQ7_PARUN